MLYRYQHSSRQSFVLDSRIRLKDIIPIYSFLRYVIKVKNNYLSFYIAYLETINLQNAIIINLIVLIETRAEITSFKINCSNDLNIRSFYVAVHAYNFLLLPLVASVCVE